MGPDGGGVELNLVVDDGVQRNDGGGGLEAAEVRRLLRLLPPPRQTEQHRCKYIYTLSPFTRILPIIQFLPRNHLFLKYEHSFTSEYFGFILSFGTN